jgi:hypothetical protein
LVPKIGIDINFKYNSSGGVYSKSFEVFRNNNSDFVNPELKSLSYATVRIGLLVSL